MREKWINETHLAGNAPECVEHKIDWDHDRCYRCGIYVAQDGTPLSAAGVAEKKRRERKSSMLDFELKVMHSNMSFGRILMTPEGLADSMKKEEAATQHILDVYRAI